MAFKVGFGGVSVVAIISLFLGYGVGFIITSSSLKSSINDLSSSLETVQTQVTSNNQQIETLSAELDRYQLDVISYETKIETFETQVSSMSADLDTMRARAILNDFQDINVLTYHRLQGSPNTSRDFQHIHTKVDSSTTIL